MLSVFLTFFCAGITNFSASVTKQRGMFTANSHQACACIAGFCTFAVELDASREHLNILFIEAFRGTMIAFLRAVQTGLDARLIFFVTHF
jgi:hypothetical protein